MKKKGELSLNIIIVAVIGLLVLVIIAVIFMQRMGAFRRGSSDCSSLGGTCKPMCDAEEATIPGAVCYTGDGQPDPLMACCGT